MIRHWRKWFWLVLFLTTLWGFLIEPGLMIFRYLPIEVANWPTLPKPVKIVLLSDLHVGMLHQSTDRLRDLVHRINVEEPDMIALLGDYLTASSLPPVLHQEIAPETIAGILRNLRARLGVYAVLGNHDCWINCRGMRKALEKVGIPVLNHARRRIGPAGAGGWWLLGLADRSEVHPNWNALFQGIAPTDAIMIMGHDPAWFQELPPTSPPVLMVSGHTHGGQISLPWIGPLALPTPIPLAWAHGHIVIGNRHLVVTSGIGTTVLPIRVNVPPEVMILQVTGEPS